VSNQVHAASARKPLTFASGLHGGTAQPLCSQLATRPLYVHAHGQHKISSIISAAMRNCMRLYKYKQDQSRSTKYSASACEILCKEQQPSVNHDRIAHFLAIRSLYVKTHVQHKILHTTDNVAFVTFVTFQPKSAQVHALSTSVPNVLQSCASA
jgi:hypothetical protein